MRLFSFRLRRFSGDPKTDESLRHSVKDGVGFSIMTGAAESYFSAFALFFKASTAQIGILASLPPLIGSFAQLFSAWLGRHGRSRRALILFGAFGQGLMILPILLLPWLFDSMSVMVLIACVIIYFVSVNIASPQWWSLMGDLVPEHRRGRYFAMRSRLCSLTAFISFVIAGVILHSFDKLELTIVGFAILFIIAAVARLISVYHLSQMVDPPGHVAVLESPFQRNIWRRLRGSTIAMFSIFVAAMQFSVAIASPFFIVYMLRDLQMSYIEFTTITAAMILSQFLSLPRWGRVSDVFGNRVVMLFCGSLIPFLPLLWVVSNYYWYLLLIQAFGGFIWAGFTLSSGNYVYELVPANKRTTYLALHNVLIGCAVFVGALIGGSLSEILPRSLQLGDWHFQWLSALYGIFVLSAVLRMLVAVIFLPRIREQRQVKPLTWQGLVSKVLQLRSRRKLIKSLTHMRKTQRLRTRI